MSRRETFTARKLSSHVNQKEQAGDGGCSPPTPPCRAAGTSWRPEPAHLQLRLPPVPCAWQQRCPQGQQHGLWFCFISWAFLQPPAEQTGFSEAGAPLRRGGLTQLCPAGQRLQPGEEVTRGCSRFRGLTGCIFARVKKSQRCSPQMYFPSASRMCAAFPPTEKQTVN